MAMDRERPRGRKRRKVCTFCVDKVEHIDYKDAVKLRRFLSERARSCPAAPPAPAPCTSVSSLRPSSAPVRSLCCPTSPTKSS